MNNQREMFVEFPMAVTPAPEWKTFPADGGDLRYKQIDEKTTEIDFDGQILTAIRGAEERYAVRDSEGRSLLPNRARGFRNTMSRVAMVRNARREKARAVEARARSAEADASYDAAAERVFVAAESEDPQPTKPRCRNKLAPATNDFAELHFFNPKQLIGALLFSPVPSWLTTIEDITPAEQLVYGAMIFRADADGIFRRSIRGLCRLIKLDPRGVQKAADSLEGRPLIFKITAFERKPNHYKFVWDERFDRQSGERCSPDLPGLGEQPGEQRSSGLANSVHQAGEQRSPHKNQEPKELKHEHDHVHALSEQPKELTPAKQDLLDRIEELTAIENRTEHFRRLWITYIREWPNEVFKAIGQTRLDKLEGKISKSIGGKLHWHFKSFRADARKRRIQA